jgi:excisionase family DNA binding protein
VATKSPARDVIQPLAADHDALEALEAKLARVPANTTFCLSAPDTEPMELPESLYRALRDAAQILRQGSAVVISPLQRRLSTTEAGDLLGVSRQYLTRLIDKGEIPCDRTGRHRRLMLSDVLNYKRRRDEARRAFLDDFTAESAEAGFYD